MIPETTISPYLKTVVDKVFQQLPAGSPSLAVSDFKGPSDDQRLIQIWANFSGTQGKNAQLDRNDLFHALINTPYGEDPPTAARIRHFLGYPDHDPEGVRLQFRVAQYGQEQVAYIVITPSLVSPSVPTSIVGTGLFHPMSLSIPAMVELAKRLKAPVAVYDAPGMGASRRRDNDAVSPNDLMEAQDAVIRAVVPVGGRYNLTGFSLSSVPAMMHYQSGIPDRILNRLVIEGGIPALIHSLSGSIRVNRLFLWKDFFSLIANAGDIRPHHWDAFDNCHSPDEKTWMRNQIQNESYPVSPLGFIHTLLAASWNAVSDKVGVDPRLRVVMYSHDHIMESYPEVFRNRRGYIVVGDDQACADHDALRGPRANSHWVQSFADALSQPLTQDPILSHNELYRNTAIRVQLGTQSHNAQSLSGTVGFALRRGLTAFSTSGVFAKTDTQLYVGRNSKDMMLGAILSTSVGLESFQLPLDMQAGFCWQLNWGREVHAQPYVEGNVEVAELVKLGGQYLLGFKDTAAGWTVHLRAEF